MENNDKTWVRFKNTIPTSKHECFFCGERLNDYNRTVDHLHPKSKGGIRSNDNKVYACLRCNKFKDDSTVDMFVGMVKFLIDEMERDHDAKMSYYRNVHGKLNLLIETKKQNERKSNSQSSSSGARQD